MFYLTPCFSLVSSGLPCIYPSYFAVTNRFGWRGRFGLWISQALLPPRSTPDLPQPSLITPKPPSHLLSNNWSAASCCLPTSKSVLDTCPQSEMMTVRERVCVVLWFIAHLGACFLSLPSVFFNASFSPTSLFHVPLGSLAWTTTQLIYRPLSVISNSIFCFQGFY